MKQEEKINDPRISRTYFSFPAYIALVFLVAVLMMLPTFFYGGFHLILEKSGPYLKWYFVYCLLISLLISAALGVQKYIVIDRPIRRLSAAARKVAEGDFSLYLPPRHTSDDMDYIDTLYVDFNQMVAELGSIETLKNDFAANVSHELKTPLSAINNYIQLLQNTDLTEEQKSYVDSALESTHRLAALIFNILKLNKLESQKIKPQARSYDLCRQLADCIIGFESVWEQKEIEFEADMEDTAVIEADEELMALVWNNLLSNAFKFTGEGGSVFVRQYSKERYAVIEVSDTGCGMSRQTTEHIFDKFYQGDTSHSTEGNGLGLPLALRILQMSNGTITVNSTEGKGTTFTIRIPMNVKTENDDKE